MANPFRNPNVRIPSLVVLGGGVLAGVLVYFTRNWLVALVATLTILAVVLVVVLLRVLLGRDREDQLERGLETEERGVRREPGARALRERFKEALAEIKATLGDRGGVYALPWYLVMGESGSGKSALLSECGLDLPAQYARSRVFGPTQNCEFLLANQAIVLDTAGRYLTSDADADREEWKSLLSMLRGSRPDCPANGLVFTLSVPSLMSRSAHELEEDARQLRRRINEIQVGLGVDLPIYIVLTKADLIDGFVETAGALPPEQLGQAFGWTNDQRRIADPEGRIGEAFSGIRDRLDRLLPGFILREPDPDRRRRIFCFPQELEVVARTVAAFVGTAFKRDIYNDTPFLRGVYLTSSRSEGTTLSATLQRLGHDWARTQHAAEAGGPLFLRDLVLDIVLGDEGLAMPESRMGALGRRAVLGSAGVVAFCALALWGASFVENYQGSARLAESSAIVLRPDPSIPELNALRDRTEREALASASLINWIGFSQIEQAVERARITYVHAFGGSFARPTTQNLSAVLRHRGDTAFRAAVALATNLEFLASRGEADAPDLASYVPRRVTDTGSFDAAYVAYVRWLPESDRDEEIREGRDLLARAAARLIDLVELERQTEQSGGRFSAVRYADICPEAGDEDGSLIPGIYTQAGFDGLFARLLIAVEKTGSVSSDRVNRFRRAYVERYERDWRRFLLNAPERGGIQEEVKESCYIGLIEQIDLNTRVDLPRDGKLPEWIAMLREVRRTLPMTEAELKDDGPEPPWKAYETALEGAHLDVEDAVSGGQALLLAREVAQGKPNSFSDALATIRRIVPRDLDASAMEKLRTLLALPILDGFSAVLVSAKSELDRRWYERVASRFRGELSPQDLDRLYQPESGELDIFRLEELDAFYRDGGPRQLLGDRTLEFGAEFLSWMDRAVSLQRALFPAASSGSGSGLAVRLKGIPSTLRGTSSLRVKRQDLRLICPDGEQSFVYRQGYGAETFSWSPGCQEVGLRVVIGAAEGVDQEIRKTWRGPLALSRFFQEAEPLGDGVFQWAIDGPGGISLIMKYRLMAGREILEIVHSTPPGSLGG